MTYESAHRPVIEKGQQYIQWTLVHQQAAQGMPPCAVRLWQYLLTKYPGGVPQEIELEFCRFDISDGRSKVYSVQSLKNAMKCLIDLDLLIVVKKFTARVFKVIAKHAGAVKPIANKFVKPQNNLRLHKEICEAAASNPDATVPSYREIKIQQTPDVVASLQTINEENTKPDPKNNQPLISDEKIKEMEALKVELSPALRIAVATAAVGVYEGAIALLKTAKAENKVRSSTAFLLSAIRKGWHVPIEQIIKDKQSSFIEWRKASKANDAAAKYSCTNGDCIEISADNETWIEWEATS